MVRTQTVHVGTSRSQIPRDFSTIVLDRALLYCTGMPSCTQLATLLFTASLITSACGSDEDEPEVPITPVAQTTWHQDVAPIVHEKCVGCHQSVGGIAPFGLESFEQAGPIADFMLSNVESGNMPPWDAVDNPDCTPQHNWKKDARISDEQLAVLQAWVRDGAPEGDPATAAELPTVSGPQALAGTTHTLAITPYVTEGFTDELRCFLLDPGLTRTQYMTGVEIIPSNLEVAHHATLTVIPPDNADKVRQRVEPNGSFPCTGGAGMEGSYSLGVWVPGTAPFETPANTGTPLAPGALVMLQMHYHPTGFAHEADQTQVKLRMTETKPEQTFLFVGFGNAGTAPNLLPGENDNGTPRFLIPANVDKHTETMEFTVEAAGLAGKQVPIVAITPHMHYVGQSIQVTINRANPVAEQSPDECLVNVDQWDFNWQRTYQYDSPLESLPTVTQGDTITLKCGYNNTISNPLVQRMLDEEGLANPIDVRLGEQTTDEMCIALMGIVF